MPALSVRNVSKAFGGRLALADVSLDVMPGEIHGLLGQNGSGKSTLIKILAGYHPPEPGAALWLHGAPVPTPLSSGSAREHGMAFVHQDLGLIDGLSILDNMRVGKFRAGRAGQINWRKERQLTRTSLARVGLQLDPDVLIRDLSQGTRAIVAIARALDELGGRNKGVLILDEPTPYLPKDSVAVLFESVRQVARRGISILFVSHRLEEALEITDRITVLRDGHVVTSEETEHLDLDRLVEMIVGRRLDDLYPTNVTEPKRDRLLSIRGLKGAAVHDFDLDLYSGEVLGVTGLLGSGFEELPYLLMGASPVTRGFLTLEPALETDMRGLSIRQRIERGMVLVPANRESQGAAMKLTAEENIILPRLSEYFRRFLLDARAERRDVVDLMLRFEITPCEPERIMATFSGGNQQKALIAKHLSTRPRVVVLHEPTQGVDVGARKTIFSALAHATQAGCAIILASLEYGDLAHLCDRVMVFRDGRVTAELRGRELTENRIVEQCLRADKRTIAR